MACLAPPPLGPRVRKGRRAKRAPTALLARKVLLVSQAAKGMQVIQDHEATRDYLEQQALRVLQAQQDLLVQSAHLVLGVQMAWLGLWARPVLRASEDFRASQVRRARTVRLVRRGVPGRLARQGLRVV